ncbi:hypothetical protein J3B02_003098, partial [Coemansia erecta]
MVSGSTDSDAHSQSADNPKSLPVLPQTERRICSLALQTQPMVTEKTRAQTPPASARTPPMQLKGSAVRSRPATPGQQNTVSATQLLRKISVAGVTVEVVRQDSTIIYRLPDNMPVSSLTPEQRTKVMDEIQRMRKNTAAPSTARANTAAVKQPTRPQQPGTTNASRPGAQLPTPTSAGVFPQRQSQLQQKPPSIRVSKSATNLSISTSTAQLRTVLPNIAPRTVTPVSSAPSSGQASPRSASASVSTSASALQANSQASIARPQPRLQIRPGNAPLQPRQTQPSPAPSSTPAQ